MPGLRDRSALETPKKYESWTEGDSHAPTAVRIKMSREKAKSRENNKKYGKIRKEKKEETLL